MNLLVVIADGWGYTHGGINVFNREMCKGFYQYLNGQTHVICLAPDISEDEIRIVNQDEGIELISVTEEEFKIPTVIVGKVRDYCNNKGYASLSITWLGHDTYSDFQAIECKKRWHDSRCAVIHHMSYSTYYPLVNADTDKTQKKESDQRERLKAADIVFSNGPLLKESAQDLRGGIENVFEILPGVYHVENIKEKYIPNTFSVVTFGRVESAEGTKRNNSIIKQIFLAAASWSKFTTTLRSNQESVMKVYGKSCEGADNEVFDIVKKHFKDIHSFTMIPYEKDHTRLLEEIANYSLCLVLSSKEGFGLTALEAISAGVPIIVSQSSGFFQSLHERGLDGFVHSIRVRASLDEPYFSEDDLERATKEIEEVYYDQENAKKKTIMLKNLLTEKGYTWDNCAGTILEKLGWLDESNINKEIVSESQEKKAVQELSLAERFVIGQDIKSMNIFDQRKINEAFNEAQRFFFSHISFFYFEEVTCNEQLFQNISANDVSIRFLYAQEPYMDTYTIQRLYLNVIEAVKYGFDYSDCVPSSFWEEEDQFYEGEYKLIEKAKKKQKQLTEHKIPDNEINQYSLFALLNNGYSFRNLYKKHYDINVLVRFGIEKESLSGYYTEAEIACALQMAEELVDIIESPELGKYEQFGPKYLAKKFDAKAVLEVYSVEEIFHAFDIYDILQIQPMVSAKALKQGGYSAKELADNGFSLRQLEAAGFETENLVFNHKKSVNIDSNILQELVSDIIFELEEEEYQEEYLCKSVEAELLKRLKERGLTLSQIRGFLPFMIESCPCHVKWLLMAQYTIDELETEKIVWKDYFKELPVNEWIANNEYENYQYDGVLPLVLLKAGIRISQIEEVYGTKAFSDVLKEIKGVDIITLREQGFTAKAFYNLGKSLVEIIDGYSCEKEEDIRELALSGYELRDLRKTGFSIGQLKKQFAYVLNLYDLQDDNSPWSRYGYILDFISKHGE
ncbi:MAG: glycosyltransferase [Anaerostipes sp.]|nr:glycosyltransferase [Anaerostipes sp.]